jgi:hypothetical protein
MHFRLPIVQTFDVRNVIVGGYENEYEYERRYNSNRFNKLFGLVQ